MKKTLLNIFYNAIYQIFLVLVPLITVPYLSRSLGPKTYGIYSSVNNTTQFLMVFCSLSISYIGMRTISRTRAHSTRTELTNAFWGLWYFQALASMAMIVCTVIFLSISHVRYWNYLLLMVPFMVSAQLDISWFFQGLAEFGKVVLRNTLVKLSSVVLIFWLVKSPADLNKYLLIMSLSTLAGSLVFWFGIRNYVDGPTKHFYKFKESVIAIITLLIPQIATQVYTSLDKPILGWYQNSTQVSFYDNSQRISNMILGVITSITLVMMPKMAAEGKDKQRVVLKKSLEATVMLGILFAVVVMVNTKQFVPFFFGEKYIPMTNLMFWFTLTIIIIPMGGVFANQFALANKRDLDYAIPVVVGAVSELILSYFFDRAWAATGALIAILITEIIVCVLRLWIVRDAYEFKYVFADVPKYFLIGLISFAAGMLMPNVIPSAFLNMCLKSIIVMAIYIGLMFVFKLDLNKDLVVMTKKFLHRG
ncbi:MAG: oligosaccharide flippase family protein [Lactobacillus sp.]|nr:oligosaccharide flippase family protein [Lactobacillus sp.]MCH3905803.1 oligosaccharide flippase family protein [Lactobacillus sp.]MCH3990617.1 oligosaccharide flippase family protein [Lactobacillus sp.]MCH4068667.1 oligosaccharide flippase family protein [Lactobacillus sp.]MCI1303848.1 oligosaccharide flippase family protein [Lactobacillus sp.]